MPAYVVGGYTYLYLKFLKWTWRYSDDIIIANIDQYFLEKIVSDLVSKFTKVHWLVNSKKSVLIPAHRVQILGVWWMTHEVRLNPPVLMRLYKAWDIISNKVISRKYKTLVILTTTSQANFFLSEVANQ